MMKQLSEELGILNLVRKNTQHNHTKITSDTDTQSIPASSSKKIELNLNKDEIRLLVKILKAIGHTCEHQNITVKNGITHYQYNHITLIFDDVKKPDENTVIHLSPLSTMLNDPSQKRPTWEKLKTLKS